MASCHRLKQTANAPIILRFTDIAQRNAWLFGAKNLRDGPHPDNVSLSPDMPPVLRELKTQLLNIRKDMPAEQRKLCSVRYLAQWPYTELKVHGQGVKQHAISRASIVEKVLGFNPGKLPPEPAIPADN